MSEGSSERLPKDERSKDDKARVLAERVDKLPNPQMDAIDAWGTETDENLANIGGDLEKAERDFYEAYADKFNSNPNRPNVGKSVSGGMRHQEDCDEDGCSGKWTAGSMYTIISDPTGLTLRMGERLIEVDPTRQTTSITHLTDQELHCLRTHPDKIDQGRVDALDAVLNPKTPASN